MRYPGGASADDLVDRADVWYVFPDGSNLEEAVADAAAVVDSDGLPWFDWARDPSALLGRLQAGVAGDHTGTATSPNVALLVGFVAQRAGIKDVARTNLIRAQQHPGFGLFAGDIDAAIKGVG